MSYYAVHVPVKGGGPLSTSNTINTNSSTLIDSANNINNDNSTTDTADLVFQKKKDALNALKQHKDARLKEFLNEDEAIKFAQTGFETVQNKYNDVKNSVESLEKAAFKAPTKQQLIRFRQIIETDDWQYVKKLIWENPRYLVSSGDTPTILKEGYRYNAMHVCATHNCTNVAKLILDTISDPKFTDLLMGKKKDEKVCIDLCANLLDYYLNIPEKGRNETPLHLASKFGHAQIVSILMSYPECKMLRNSQCLLPKTIICERKNKHLLPDVLNVFEERYYVPVLRSNDNTIPGQIGEPFLANNPPALNSDPLSPEIEIKAVAGPMREEQAKTFFRRWKTPPRMGSNVSSPIASNPFISPMKSSDGTPRKTSNNLNTTTATTKRRSLFNSTPQRHDGSGINTNGFDASMLNDTFDSKQNENHKQEENKIEYYAKDERNYNNNHFGDVSKPQNSMFKTPLYAPTPLFKLKSNAFSIYRDQNIASPIVCSVEYAQDINDSLLNVSNIYDSPGFKERHVKNIDPEKGLECIGRVLAKEKNIEWREYWDFLGEFVDIASEHGMRKLENYLAQRQKEQDQLNNRSETIHKSDILDDVCNVLENAFRITSTPTTTISTNISTSHQSTTPYTYVEKSLQVHARRMTKTILHNIDNETSIADVLLLELRRIKSLIYSFKEDASYKNVHFEKVHSRIGNLVSMFLENSQEVSKQMKSKILVVLENISREQGERREHMECVCSRIFQILQHPTKQIPPENVKTEEMCSQIWSEEIDCDCQWESNLSRKTSYRSRIEARYKSQQRLKQQETLQQDIKHQNKIPNKEDARNTKDDSDDDSADEEFWSDFGDSYSDESEVFLTPRESPSLFDALDDTDEESSKLFIYGDEPTKRDLDVLNAIFHINIDKTKYPNIHSWKSNITSYPNDEMDFFPSPRCVKKSYSFMATNSNKKDIFAQPQTPLSTQKSYSFVRSSTSPLILHSSQQQSSLAGEKTVSLSNMNHGIIKEPIIQLPVSKRLFMSPGRTKSATDISLGNNTNLNYLSNGTLNKTKDTEADTINVATAKLPAHQQLQTQRPLTPFNKMRGLFSAYRECPNNSPLSTPSPSSDSYNSLQ